MRKYIKLLSGSLFGQHNYTKTHEENPSEYKYQYEEAKLDAYFQGFTSRIGDGSGDVEESYLSAMNLIFTLKENSSMLDIGCGFGRLMEMAVDKMSRIVGLEPDEERYRNTKSKFIEYDHVEVYNKDASEYLLTHTGNPFDLVLISMVIQHLSTRACIQLLKDAQNLVDKDGVVVIATTHVPESAKGFSFSDATPSEIYLSEVVFNKHAENHELRPGAICVRRFSKDELLNTVAPFFNILHWAEFAYLRPVNVPVYAKNLQVSSSEVEHLGISQYAVLKKI